MAKKIKKNQLTQQRIKNMDILLFFKIIKLGILNRLSCKNKNFRQEKPETLTRPTQCSI